MASWRVSRFAYGAWRVSFKTGLDKFGVQIADVGTITVPKELFSSYGHSGLSTDVKWEVIGKRVQPAAPAPHIEWTLMIAYEDSPPSATQTSTPKSYSINGLSWSVERSTKDDDVERKHVVSGFTISGISGFDCVVDEGKANAGNGTFIIRDTDLTVNASKDTYAGVDFLNACIVTEETALGAGTPTEPGNVIWLQKIVSDGAGITGSTDLRVTTALDGAKIVSSTVAENQLATGAVTQPKVGDYAISPQKTIGSASRLALNSNFSLQSYTRG